MLNRNKILSRALTALNHGLKFISGEGSWQIDPTHQKIIFAVLEVLPPAESDLVSTQLKEKYFYDRMTDGMVNVIRFENHALFSKLPVPKFADCLFKVELDVEGRKQWAHVTFYDGRIFSVELKRPSKFFHGKTIAIGQVKEGKPADSVTRTIDRAAHGVETEINP